MLHLKAQSAYQKKSHQFINVSLLQATQFDGSTNPVLAVRGAALSDFGGRSLSVRGSSQLIVNPDLREAHVLRGWFDKEGSGMEFGTFKGEGPSSGKHSFYL